jgi:uncharacterized membrane protein
MTAKSYRRPLHPPLVHIAIGGVVAASVCDVVSTVAATHPSARAWFVGGSYALIIGTTVLILAAIAGLADRARSTQKGSVQRSKVNRHALVMSFLGLVCIVDLVLRNNVYSTHKSTPAAVLALTLVALVVMVAGGELGGRLVYRQGVGVRSAERADSGPEMAAQAPEV